jgi:hypothetical protein
MMRAMADDSRHEPPREVLSSLPHSRPQRRSARRDAEAKPAKARGTTAAKRSPSGAKRAPSGAGPAAAERSPSGAGRVKAAADAAARDLLVKGPRVGPRAPVSNARRPTRVKPRPAPRPPSPASGARAATREGGAKGHPRSVEPPSAPEIIGAAVQSAGELAQLGLKAGSQLLRSAAARLPKGP